MFSYKYTHSVDNKGRVFIPSKFRETLGASFVVTIGIDGCISAYTNEQWEEFATALDNATTTKEGRNLLRRVMAAAAECELDKQGRIVLPAELRKFAGIENEAVFVGMVRKVEIWGKERYEAQDETNGSLEDLAESLAEKGVRF